MNKRKQFNVYMDNETKEKLQVIATAWGCSLSHALVRLVREHKENK